MSFAFWGLSPRDATRSDFWARAQPSEGFHLTMHLALGSQLYILLFVLNRLAMRSTLTSKLLILGF